MLSLAGSSDPTTASYDGGSVDPYDGALAGGGCDGALADGYDDTSVGG